MLRAVTNGEALVIEMSLNDKLDQILKGQAAFTLELKRITRQLEALASAVDTTEISAQQMRDEISSMNRRLTAVEVQMVNLTMMPRLYIESKSEVEEEKLNGSLEPDPTPPRFTPR